LRHPKIRTALPEVGMFVLLRPLPILLGLSMMTAPVSAEEPTANASVATAPGEQD